MRRGIRPPAQILTDNTRTDRKAGALSGYLSPKHSPHDRLAAVDVIKPPKISVPRRFKHELAGVAMRVQRVAPREGGQSPPRTTADL